MRSSCLQSIVLCLAGIFLADAWVSPSMMPRALGHSSFVTSRNSLQRPLWMSGGEGEDEESNELVFDDDECYDLCEIDWDDMPDDEDDKEKVDETAQATEPPSAARMQQRLEMQWQVLQRAEDCSLEMTTPDCGTRECPDCHHTGVVACRFCHGAKVLLWMKENQDHTTASAQAQDCPICERQGSVVCPTCKGTGYIAPWAELSTSAKP